MVIEALFWRRYRATSSSPIEETSAEHSGVTWVKLHLTDSPSGERSVHAMRRSKAKRGSSAVSKRLSGGMKRFSAGLWRGGAQDHHGKRKKGRKEKKEKKEKKERKKRASEISSVYEISVSEVTGDDSSEGRHSSSEEGGEGCSSAYTETDSSEESSSEEETTSSEETPSESSEGSTYSYTDQEETETYGGDGGGQSESSAFDERSETSAVSGMSSEFEVRGMLSNRLAHLASSHNTALEEHGEHGEHEEHRRRASRELHTADLLKENEEEGPHPFLATIAETKETNERSFQRNHHWQGRWAGSTKSTRFGSQDLSPALRLSELTELEPAQRTSLLESVL